jgi:CheY-like chemotaxis protein
MRNITVAVIDDERDVLTYLISALQDNGFVVHSASNANDGLEMIRREKPDLVCIDILMPRETGYSLYRKIKEDDSIRDIPVLIITGLNIEHDSIRPAIENGRADILQPAGFIEKPVNISKFISTIKELTG